MQMKTNKPDRQHGSQPLARPELVLCEHCDHACRRQALAKHERAYCNACGNLLYRGRQIDVQARLALSLAALMLYLLANLYPLLQIQFKGLHSETTMLQATLTLAHGPLMPIALPVALCMLVAPLVQILLLNWILLHILLQRTAPGFASLMRLYARLRPWSMLEVGVLGVIVAMVKLSSLVEVDISTGIWALGILALMLSLILDNDLEQLWTMHPPADTAA
jgi:paraquat-inducible protein A